MKGHQIYKFHKIQKFSLSTFKIILYPCVVIKQEADITSKKLNTIIIAFSISIFFSVLLTNF